MKPMRSIIWIGMSFLLMVAVTAAATQGDLCPNLVQTALNLTASQCQDTGRNQACYGHIKLEAQPQSGYEDFKFDQIGDTVSLAALRSLRLSALDVENQLWGVALMRVQANLPNNEPSQNAEFLLFGDVEIENAAPTFNSVQASILAGGNVNVRRTPNDQASVLVSLPPGEIVQARAVSHDGNWVNIDVPRNDGQVGWVLRQFITSNSNLETLPASDSLTATYGPMQAFYLKTSTRGGSQLNCEAVPGDGLLVQTPEGTAKVRLWINEVRIELGSTGFIQATPNSEMVVKMLEGEASVTAMGVSYRAPAGTQVSIRLNENNVPAEPPSPPQPLQIEDLVNLPLAELDRPIVIADPLTEEAIIEQALTDPIPSPSEEELLDDLSAETPINQTVQTTNNGGETEINNAPGNSENAPGITGDLPHVNGNDPGNSGNAPGITGDLPNDNGNGNGGGRDKDKDKDKDKDD